MTYYFLTSRNIETLDDGQAVFGNGQGQPHFVISPKDAKTLSPDHIVRGPRAGERWGKKILEDVNAKSECGNIVLMVPGFNTDANDAFLQHKTMKAQLIRAGLGDAVFVGYSWPSQGSFMEYMEDDVDARFAALHLMTTALSLFARMSRHDCRIKVNVIAHSSGALVVKEAFRAAMGYKPTRDSGWGIANLLLVGANLSVSSLNTEDGKFFLESASRITNYFNREDTVLATSNVKRYNSAPRLGRHGAPINLLDDIVDVDVTDHWLTVSQANGVGTIGDVPASHNFYRNDILFARDMAQTIKGDIDRRAIASRGFSEEPGRLTLS